MITKTFTSKSGAFVLFEKDAGWYKVLVRAPSGDLHDKMRCDSYSEALAYYRSFCKIARNLT
jgi:hypothetical protein